MDALVYEVEQAIMQGTDRLAALEVARKALDTLTARISELEAALDHIIDVQANEEDDDIALADIGSIAMAARRGAPPRVAETFTVTDGDA